MRIKFRAYVHVFEDYTPSNTLRAGSLGAIALTPTDNTQGDYFPSPLALATGFRATTNGRNSA